MIRDERGWWWWQYRCSAGDVFRLLIVRRETYCPLCGASARLCVPLREAILKQDWSPRRNKDGAEIESWIIGVPAAEAVTGHR